MQARARCSHGDGNTTRGGNSSDLISCEGLDRSLFASATGGVSRTEQKEKVKAVVATADQMSRAPIGNSNHRIWKCQAEPLKGARAKWSREADRKKEASCDVAGHPA